MPGAAPSCFERTKFHLLVSLQIFLPLVVPLRLLLSLLVPATMTVISQAVVLPGGELLRHREQKSSSCAFRRRREMEESGSDTTVIRPQLAMLSLQDVALYFCVCSLVWKVLRWLASLVGSWLLRFEGSKEVIVHLNGVYYPCSYWAEKGMRPYMEDRFQMCKGKDAEDSSCYAVFDGHGGSRAAQYCSQHLLANLTSTNKFGQDMEAALKEAFHSTENKFFEAEKRQGCTDGTTAVVAVVHSRKIFVANAGDSRAIIVRRGAQVQPLSSDHKPSRQDEEARIKALGGRVVFWGRWRVEGVLAVSRAIGDINLKPFVTCEPEIMAVELSADDMFLVLATDGVWDVMSNEQVARLVMQSADFKHAARDLCHEAMLLGSTDNVTAMVVDLRNLNSVQHSDSLGRNSH